MAQSTSSRSGAHAKTDPLEAPWGKGCLSARFRQIQCNHKHGRREHVERKSKHSNHSVGWLGVCARKSTRPTSQAPGKWKVPVRDRAKT
jgi:hypothetical protein